MDTETYQQLLDELVTIRKYVTRLNESTLNFSKVLLEIANGQNRLETEFDLARADIAALSAKLDSLTGTG